MKETADSWKEGVPADLIPAIEHLRESFDKAHWGCGQTTKLFCYAMLHKQRAPDPGNEHLNWLRHMKAVLGPALTLRFNSLLRSETLPAIFKAFFDFYVEGVSNHAIVIFKELLDIGRTHEKRLGTASLEWAKAQTQHTIRSHAGDITRWVREVCDRQGFDPGDDTEELIFWRKWQAPSLIVMTPSRYRPYEPETVWQRHDAETSSQWLKAFTDDYILRLETRVKEVAGLVALESAKRGAQVRPSDREDNSESETIPASATSDRLETDKVRRQARKLNTQDKYESWQRAYRKLLKSNPNMSDVWYSRKIAKLPIAKESSPETIRKHMKK